MLDHINYTYKIREVMKQPLPDRLICFLLLATFFFLPLLTAPVTICGVAAIAFWILSGRCWHDRHLWLRQKWTIPLLLIIIMQFVSLCWSSDLALGYKLVQRNYFGLLGFVALSVTHRVSSSTRLAVYSFLLGLASNVTLCLLQLSGLIAWRHRDGGYGIMGYITFSLLLVIGMLFLSWYFSKTSSTRIKLTSAATFSIFFLVLILLPGRGGYLAFVASLPIMLWNFGGHYKRLVMFILGIVLFGGLALSPTVQKRVGMIPQEAASYNPGHSQNLSTSVSQRLHMWYGAMELFQEHPLIGIGIGSYKKQMERFSDRIKDSVGGFSHPHNSYFYVAASYGLIGILLYGWLLYLLVTSSFRHRNTAGGFMAFSVFFVMLVGSLTDTQIVSNATGMLLGIVPGIIPVSEVADSTQAQKS